MQVVFLDTAEPGLRWFRDYYDRVFPNGKPNALGKYRASLKLLADNPKAGHPVDGYLDVRELTILRTPFSFLYILDETTINIIDVRDARGMRSIQRLEDYLNRKQ